MAPEVASALARLGQRERFTGGDDLVFPGTTGGHLDGDALSKRYGRTLDRSALWRLRFHDLRHTFGTRMIAKAEVRRVQEWMGHADIQTTMKSTCTTRRAKRTRRSWSRRSGSAGRLSPGGRNRRQPTTPAWVSQADRSRSFGGSATGAR
jgi:integrase